MLWCALSYTLTPYRLPHVAAWREPPLSPSFPPYALYFALEGRFQSPTIKYPSITPFAPPGHTSGQISPCPQDTSLQSVPLRQSPGHTSLRYISQYRRHTRRTPPGSTAAFHSAGSWQQAPPIHPGGNRPLSVSHNMPEAPSPVWSDARLSPSCQPDP